MNNIRRLPQDPDALNQAQFEVDRVAARFVPADDCLLVDTRTVGILIEYPDLAMLMHALRRPGSCASIEISLVTIEDAILEDARVFERRAEGLSWADAFEAAARRIRAALVGANVMSPEDRRLREERDKLREALTPIVDCYGVGYRDPAKFCRDVEEFMLAARAALGEKP